MNYRFDGLLTCQGFIFPAYVQLDEKGTIVSIGENKEKGLIYENVTGYALPGLVNAHSHAFQYAMSGLAELHKESSVKASFWTWRDVMYKFAMKIDPAQLEVIASLLYSELLKCGYTHVVEFQYLHHNKDGKPYTNLAEMGERLIAAAKKVGIRITLIPIFYQKGGFLKPYTKQQRRFISHTIEDYLGLLEATLNSSRYYKRAEVSDGVHSLRAVDPALIVEYCKNRNENQVFHIHAAEQQQEVDDCLVYLGQRPIDWILSHLPVNGKYNIVHATHMTKEETRALANSFANVVLCPSTEGNLGDGFFDLVEYIKNHGTWCIGTDSHISIQPMEELRLLDYGQRLSHQKRNVVGGNNGEQILSAVLHGGSQAIGNNNGFFETGNPFDALIIDSRQPIMQPYFLDSLASRIVYSSDRSHILGTIIDGQWIVKNQYHEKQDAIINGFFSCIKDLMQ